jgi:putative transposase
MVRHMLGFKSSRSARIIMKGIELLRIISKVQMVSDAAENLSAAKQFY